MPIVPPAVPEVVATHLTVEHETNVYSQSGEDGIIARICELYSITSGRAVDVGSWDGVYLSNTAALRKQGWATCLIEADPEKHQLAMYGAGGIGTVCVCETVTPFNLGDLLLRYFPGGPIDLLSIDVDGDDIWILVGMKIRPRIIVIEYNPTYPPFLAKANPLGSSKGSSLAAIEAVGKGIGYSLVYATISNAILVDESRNNGIIGVKDSFGAFRWDLTRFVVSDFDGANGFATISTLCDAVVNPWDGLPSAELRSCPQEMLGFNSAPHKELRQSWHDGLERTKN